VHFQLLVPESALRAQFAHVVSRICVLLALLLLLPPACRSACCMRAVTPTGAAPSTCPREQTWVSCGTMQLPALQPAGQSSTVRQCTGVAHQLHNTFLSSCPREQTQVSCGTDAAVSNTHWHALSFVAMHCSCGHTCPCKRYMPAGADLGKLWHDASCQRLCQAVKLAPSGSALVSHTKCTLPVCRLRCSSMNMTYFRPWSETPATCTGRPG
jgi:hypothetical protein